jgi:anti-anti-sigma factor
MDIVSDIVADTHVLVLHGDFDVRSTWEVRTALYEHLEGHDADVVVDLSDVTSVDITALRVLAVATRRAIRTGHHLTLRGCGPAVRRLLHISRLAHAVEVERTAASA